MARATALKRASTLRRRSTRAELEGEGPALTALPLERLADALSEEDWPPAVLEGLGPVAAEDLSVWGPLDVDPAGTPATAV